jgi:hypothetical protein
MPPAIVYEWTITYELRGEPSLMSGYTENIVGTIAQLNDHIQNVFTEGVRIERSTVLWEHYPPHDIHKTVIERGNVVP